MKILFTYLSIYLFIYFQKERERNIGVWHIDQLPLTSPQPGTRSATQVGALTGNQTCGLQDDAQPTEPHQSGLHC